MVLVRMVPVLVHARFCKNLPCRCDMMQAMFSDDFIESSARVVKFPGVSRFVFIVTALAVADLLFV